MFALALVPIIAYYSVKLGTYGYLMARLKFEQKHKRKDNGKEQT